MQRTLAIIEREMRRFRRSPTLIVISMIFPLVQLVVLGYAFGGNVKNLNIGIVHQDTGLPAGGLEPLRKGRSKGGLTIPPDFSRRVLEKNEPRLALIEDNTDSFVANT